MDERELLQREVQRERAARRQAEDLLEEKSLALYQRNRELEREVAERRRVEASLRASAAELERRNAELGQFAHVASHDLQAPLRSIIGFSQLLQRKFQPAESGLDAEGHEYLQFIETSAQRLNVVIRDLLEFSAVGDESGEGLSASLDAALDRALADLAPALRQCAAVIERKPLPAAMAADKPMVQLLRNLIDNAIKYTANGVTPRLRIEAESHNGWLRVSIHDNGIGVPPQQRERIFQIFQRLHGSEQYPGTGVGLAICRKIVNACGGRLWVEDNPAGGSVFRFTLPLAPETPS
jgi:signal transduction histidine kinase